MAGTEYSDLDQQFEDIEEVLGKELGRPDIQVQIQDLKDVYDKVQIKKLPTSEQRISQGKINGVAWTTGQVQKIRVFVQRTPDATEKVSERINIGPVELKVSYEKFEVHAVHFSVDLDSVYKTPTGDMVYTLDKVEVEERNMWQLVIVVELIDGFVGTFTSKGFPIRTKPKATKPDSQATGNNEDPTHINKRKRKESGSCYSSEANTSSPSKPEGSPYSGFDSSPCGSTTQTDRKILTDYLEAQRAHIEGLRVVNIVTNNADIAYHLNLTESARRRPDLEEGDVIAFLANEKTGETEIEKLSHDNSQRALMAGVISRSAYLYAHAPSHDADKGKTETVCVIGLVKVKVLGTVQTGERIYVALDKPGVAVPETQIPLRPFADRTPTLLGQALKSKRSHLQDGVHLVQCFVSIVLGIQSGQIANAVNNLQERMQGTFEDVVVKDRSRWLKVMCLAMAALIVVIGLAIFFLIEIFLPGSWLRYKLCEKGSLHGSVHFTFIPYRDTTQRCITYGVEFKWEDLKQKLSPTLDDVQPLNYTLPNNTLVPGEHHYYLNLDRCAHGGQLKLSAEVTGIQDNKQVCGPIIFAVNQNCTAVYYHQDPPHAGWIRYKSVNYYPKLYKQLRCKPKQKFH